MDSEVGSHLPTLRAIGQLFPVKRVVEIGAGWYSTRAFLDRQQFPHLTWLHSIEPFGAWAERARIAYEHDPRWHLSLCIHEASYLEHCLTAQGWHPLIDADVVMVDNGHSVEERAEVIRLVAALKLDALVIIHDYEVPEYQTAGDWLYSLVDQHRTPWTAVLCNQKPPQWETLRETLHIGEWDADLSLA